MKWINLESIIQSEVNQKEKKILYMNTYIWNLESSTDEPTYRAAVELHREQSHKHRGAGLRGRG